MLRLANGQATKIDSPPLTGLNVVASINQGVGAGKGKIANNYENCTFIIEYVWYQDCYYDSAEDTEPAYCDEPVIISETIIDMVCPSDPEDPCADPANFNSGECGGYEDSGQQEPPVDSLNKILDTCLKSSVKMALDNGLKNDFKDIMDSTFLNDDKLMLIIKDEVLPDTVNGKFIGFYTNTINGQDYLTGTISLNSNILPNASKEFITATLYHELLHGYLATWGGLMGQSYNHEFMASNYVNKLSTALQEVFPNLPNSDANALAWGGLHGTAMWDLRTPNQKNTILNTLLKYRSGEVGHKCN